MTTSNLNNGADEWAFGMILEFKEGPGHVIGSRNAWEDRFSGGCRLAGTYHDDGDLDDIVVHVQGAAAGWSGVHACHSEWFWEVEGGLSWTIKKGFTVEASGRGGQSGGCSDGTSFDSELIFDDSYSPCYLCGPSIS